GKNSISERRVWRFGPPGRGASALGKPGPAVPASQWQASVELVGADLKACSSVFYAPLIGFLVPSLATRGTVSEASFRRIQFRFTTRALSRTVTISGVISHVRVRLDLISDGERMALRDFRIKTLGRVRIRVEGLWLVDYCLDAVLALALELGRARLRRIGENVARHMVRQSLAAEGTVKTRR
ncbi:unnamed protein product, partial [Ixodes persulcatus]